MKLKLSLIFVMTLLWSLVTFAQEAPVQMLTNTSDQMISALKQNKSTMKSDPSAIFSIVNRILLPHVDLESMSRSVVGRTYWNQATPAQREEFKKLFTRQVIRTYAAALESYQNEQVKFYPIRGGYDASAPRVQVQSVIVRSNGQTIPVNYRLINQAGQWKVYDFSVAGVSIVQSYSSQFATALQQGGMAVLLERMRK